MARDTPVLAVIAATGAFGLAMVVLPAPVRQGFGWLLHGDAGWIGALGAGAVAYVTLLHGVLGAVMAGWALAMGLLWRGPWRVPAAAARAIVAVSVGAWYVVDSAWSAAVGAWPNVALNTVFAAAYALALARVRVQPSAP